MQDAFGIVIFVVAIGGAIVAIVTLMASGEAYKQIGRGGLSIDPDERPRPKAMTPGGGAAYEGTPAEREAEIRQMLTARNARRVRAGKEPVDVDAELARLTGGQDPTPASDPGLRDEVRQLVVARNARRVRAGQEPLDVDAEVERQLRELT